MCPAFSSAAEEFELFPVHSRTPAEEDFVDSTSADSIPLLETSSFERSRKDLAERTLSGIACAWLFSLLPLYLQDCITGIMSTGKVKKWAAKLAVESEPGLTNAQLMLTNHDLKPVEPERRQWGPWNFVGFWVADSFNIVSIMAIRLQQRLIMGRTLG
jgi:hypothetical protein